MSNIPSSRSTNQPGVNRVGQISINQSYIPTVLLRHRACRLLISRALIGIVWFLSSVFSSLQVVGVLFGTSPDIQHGCWDGSSFRPDKWKLPYTAPGAPVPQWTLQSLPCCQQQYIFLPLWLSTGYYLYSTRCSEQWAEEWYFQRGGRVVFCRKILHHS